ncbi:hypothetical protein, partial [Klebsiella michiganensis]|uniref:hypothetical protein n=1 Tax=Klebsiella michiganensis TaxID=1134687 RepID=UPI0034D1FEA3
MADWPIAIPVYRCLRAGSPGKAFTPQPGECAGIEALVRLLPGPRCACPGYGCLRAGSPGKAFTPQPGKCVGIETLVRLRPGPRCACPGYGATAVCGPVA